MSVFFDDEAIRQADAVGYLEGAEAARQFVLEDKHELLLRAYRRLHRAVWQEPGNR